ncbi:hypothetical protein [Hahella ganghwensis]|uniref:hypothetical protein n=1 Tax=Hahella ganghwensis TaxID=286420 RepID=UPI0003A3B6BB|nr:hypothetical protein [Hahella ganghwensis]
MSKKMINKPLSEQEKQTQPMPGEINPKTAKVDVFLAMQKAKNKLKVRKIEKH